MGLKEIKNEIIEHINKLNIYTDMTVINSELDKLSETNGLEGKNNLEAFYNIWKKKYGILGKNNVINSWTAYALGMTSKKPSGNFLQKRRAFARAGFPDIDTDIDALRRDEVIDYIKHKYGHENVSNLGIYYTLSMRQYLTRIIKALDLAGAYNKGKDAFVTENNQKVREIVDTIPKPISGFVRGKDENGNQVIVKTTDQAAKCFKDFDFYIQKYPQILEHSKNLEGLISNTSVHASGIAVSSIPFSKIAPLKISNKSLATQFSNEDLEKIGIIKLDMLGLKTISMIEEVRRLVKVNYGIDIDFSKISTDDKAVYKLYQEGKLDGVFQCDSYNMQKVMQEMGVDRLEDIIAGIAMYRPGPMASIPEYCQRKKGLKNIDYFHPAIEKFVKPYLERTYGIICYQEQIMQICNSLGGLDVLDGYILIKGIGKKDINLITKYKKQFIDGAKEKGVPENIADVYWEKYIIPFAAYGFNASHAAIYGWNSFKTAYLKAHYPEEFFCASLTIESIIKKADWEEKVEILMKDAKKNFNIVFSPKSINSCEVDYRVVKKRNLSIGIEKSEICPGLIAKGVGVDTAIAVAKNKPYKDLRDFARKVGHEVDKETFESFIDNGYFDGYMKKCKEKYKKSLTKETLIENYIQIKNDLKAANKKGIESVDLLA